MMTKPRFIPAALGVLALIATAAIGNVMSNGDVAKASSTPNTIYLMTIDQVGPANYDFESQNAVKTNVDWAVNLLFFNNATINAVKFQLDNYYGYKSPEEKKMANTNYGLTGWDGDGGKKGILCPVGTQWTRHYRIYADTTDDTFYSPSLGYWVVATTHKDMGECPPLNKKFYDSEEVEEHIAGIYANAGYTVYDDFGSFNNPEPYRVEGPHIWNSNGYATYIDIGCSQCRAKLR